MLAFNLSKDALGLRFVLWSQLAPKIDHRVFSARDGEERRFVIGHQLPNGGADDSNVQTQFAPIRSPESSPEHCDPARGGGHITREDAEQRSLPGAVGA